MSFVPELRCNVCILYPRPIDDCVICDSLWPSNKVASITLDVLGAAILEQNNRRVAELGKLSERLLFDPNTLLSFVVKQIR